MSYAYVNPSQGIKWISTIKNPSAVESGLVEFEVADTANAWDHYFDGVSVIPYTPEQLALKSNPPSPFHDWSNQKMTWVDRRSFDELKAAKWAEVKAARDQTEFGPFEWNSYVFDGDESAQRRLNTAYAAAKEAIELNVPYSTFWKLADNSLITLSAHDVVAVYRRLGEHNIRDNHAAAAVKYAQIQAATTKEELDAI